MKKIYNKITSKKIYIVVFLLFISLLCTIDIFKKGMALGHDTYFHISRIEAIALKFKFGKWAPMYFNQLNDFGYGEPLFYPDIFLYIPGFLRCIGLNINVCTKIFMYLINFFSILTMYISVKKITKKQYCALIGAILYATSLYKFVDIFIRSAYAESLAFIFLPLVILGLYQIFYEDTKQGYYLTIGMCGMLLSHIISFYLTCFFVLIIVLINIKKFKNKKVLSAFAANTVLSILITSFFWMPFIEQNLACKFDFYAYSPIFENVVPLAALFMDFPILHLYEEWFPAGVGLVYYIVAYIFVRYKKIVKKDNNFITIMFGLAIIAITFSCCKFLWKINIFYKVFSAIQFPWRFYLFATVFMIIGTSILFGYYKNKKLIKIVVIYSIVIFSTNMCILNWKLRMTKPLGYQIMLGEYLPQNFDMETINNYKNKHIEFTRYNGITIIDIKKYKSDLELPLVYYKGYQVCNSEKCYKTYKTEKGLVGVTIDKETKQIIAEYTGTKIYKLGKIVTSVGVALFIIYNHALNRRKKEGK